MALAVTLLGCATTRSLECAAHGGVEWLEVRTDTFRVKTNLSTTDAQSLALDLERALGVIRWTLGDDEPLEPIEVVAVDRGQLAHFGVSRKSAWPAGHPLLLERTPDPRSGHQLPTRAIFLLADHVLEQHYPLAPWWLSRGLAQYVEGMSFSGTATAALPMGDRSSELALLGDNPPALEQLLDWGPGRKHSGNARVWWAGSWLLVNHLYTHERDRVLSMLAAARKGEPVSGVEGIQLGSLARGDDFKVLILKFLSPGAIASIRPAPPVDVHLARGSLWFAGGAADVVERKHGARDELQRLIALGGLNEPEGALAAVRHALLGVRELAERFPDDPRVRRHVALLQPIGRSSSAARLREALD